ncbi:MAG: CheF family chemotaxis protein [Haloarculaceae archaeon]
MLADFTARVTVETADWSEGVGARVVLNDTALVLATGEDDSVTVPLSSVIDVIVGVVPNVFDPLPGTPVTVAYRAEGGRVAATVAAEERTIEKFATVLYKAMLNGTSVVLKHPAKVGGRVVDSEYRGGILSLSASAVQFETGEGPVTVPLSAVVDFDRETRTIDGDDRAVIVVSHVDDGTALTTVAATETPRTLAILGRYLRQEYQSVLDALSELSLSDPETEMLTTLYSAGDMDVSLPSVLDADPKAVKRLLHALHRKGLVESGENGPVLTARGRIVVTEHLERIND